MGAAKSRATRAADVWRPLPSRTHSSIGRPAELSPHRRSGVLLARPRGVAPLDHWGCQHGPGDRGERRQQPDEPTLTPSLPCGAGRDRGRCPAPGTGCLLVAPRLVRDRGVDASRPRSARGNSVQSPPEPRGLGRGPRPGRFRIRCPPQGLARARGQRARRVGLGTELRFLPRQQRSRRRPPGGHGAGARSHPRGLAGPCHRCGNPPDHPHRP